MTKQEAVKSLYENGSVDLKLSNWISGQLKKVEALENALKRHAWCETCAHIHTPGKACEECTRDEAGRYVGNWTFDEERFQIGGETE